MDYKNKTILPLVFLALAILFTWKIWPLLDGISEDKKEMVILSGENARLNGLLAKVNSLNSLYKKNEGSADKFSLILPDKDDKANLTAAFESLASANGLIIGKIIFSEPPEKKEQSGKGSKELKNDYDAETVELNLQGSYSSFKSFLRAIENNLRAMDISSVSFASSSSASSASSRSAPYIFNLKLKTYLAKPIDENNLLGEVSGSDIVDLSFVKEKKFSDLISLPDYPIKINKEADLNRKNIFAP